ncbi:MAG: hypothetical protein FJ271_32800 [Planctomycetes bacterium]|nr:hypothetical protein [Planctomycetota bacterium]
MTIKAYHWKLFKLVAALALLTFIGKRFYHDLRQVSLDELSPAPGWLLLSAILYLVGLGSSWLFWQRLLQRFGERPTIRCTMRAYFVGHLGKYVPGKAWAMLLRGSLAREGGVNIGVAIVTAFYEVLTTMASAALLAAAIFCFQPPDVPESPDLPWSPVLIGLFLLVVVSVPLWPGVFNLLLRRLAGRFASVAALKLPQVRLATLAEGLFITNCGWLLMGVSLWATLRGMVPSLPALTPSVWLHCLAALGLAYVAGFLAIVLPGGVGVREFLLLYLLRPLVSPGSESLIAVAVLVLRLLWTAAELVTAAAVYCLPVTSVERANQLRNWAASEKKP